MGRLLVTAGYGSAFFAITASIGIVLLREFIRSQFPNNSIDTSSPGAGIGLVGVALFVLFGGIFALGWLGTTASRIAPRIEAKISAKYRDYGWIGLLMFPIPFFLGWWLLFHRS
jgi:hypothetical protein